MESNVPDGELAQTRAKNDVVWNVLTIIVLLVMVCLVAVFAIIFTNPDSTVNPLKPLALPPTVALPTATSTEKYFPATWTPTVTPVPSDTPTPVPPTPTVTQFVLTVPPNSLTKTAQALPSATPSPTVASNFAFAVRATPAAVASTIIHPDQGCKWLGVGGQVFDLTGASVVGIYVKLGGSLDGKSQDMLSLTGTAIQYGPAGYEFTLSDTPLDSKQKLWVQLFDQADLPLSDKIYFDTFKDCAKNLILINFKQVR